MNSSPGTKIKEQEKNFDRPLHQPVLLRQALELLNVRPGYVWVDATAGFGGHLESICRLAGSGSTVFGIDRDLNTVEHLRQRFAGQAQIVHANYADIASIMSERDIGTINGGILADLGVSSMQLDNPERGFSFLQDGPLDMRMDPTAKVTADFLVNHLPEKQLADIIYKYGEERHSRLIAHRIVESRPLHGTRALADLVCRCVKRPSKKAYAFRDASHPATRTFQALRIAVNDELASLEKFLHDSIKLLAPGARIAVITFHSLEDRLVKQIFKHAASSCICPPRQPVCTCHRQPELLIISRKPIVPDDQEVLANPRSRSAKLRAGEKVS